MAATAAPGQPAGPAGSIPRARNSLPAQSATGTVGQILVFLQIQRACHERPEPRPAEGWGTRAICRGIVGKNVDNRGAIAFLGGGGNHTSLVGPDEGMPVRPFISAFIG